MRIIAGKWRGKKIYPPTDTQTRPTRDRIREALFNRLNHILQGQWRNKIVLDGFAGTGSLGLESLSRGAQHAYFVEKHPPALTILKKNIVLCQAESTVLPLTLEEALTQKKITKSCNVIFLDPPYNYPNIALLLEKILQESFLTPKGLLILETGTASPSFLPNTFTCISEAIYGVTKIQILQAL